MEATTQTAREAAAQIVDAMFACREAATCETDVAMIDNMIATVYREARRVAAENAKSAA